MPSTTPPASTSTGPTARSTTTGPATGVAVRGVRKTYRTTTALDDVDLDIAPGEFVAVLGPSGAGKTTLMRTLTGMVRPDAGQVRVGEDDLATLRGPALRAAQSRIGMVYQQFNLVGRLRVLTNVLLGRLPGMGVAAWLPGRFDPAAVDIAHACLERVDLADRAHQRADTLSGGQQQRVALARALCQEPRLLLADEPVASVDPRLADRIMGHLRRVNRDEGLTTVVNLHTVALAARYADRVVGLNAGRVVVDAPAAALDDPATVARIYAGSADEEELAIALPAWMSTAVATAGLAQ